MSHFASADEQDQELTQIQHQRFEGITKYFPDTPKSLANSSGLFRSKDYHYDMVRPGYALYGGNPTPETTNPMHNVVSLESRILQIRTCKKGETIGYGASYTFDKDTTTATLALGYADGFFRAHSNKAKLYYNNQPCPVIGRVSMDLVTIDISNITGKPPIQGDAVEILGANQSVDDLAISAGTIGYEILTSLGARYKREYIDS
jgi:alanine racemase